jgi:Sulfotransferase domain
MSLSVIGAGFGRTGTLSLRLALQRLGFSPCYHMVEVHKRPEHDDFWERAADGEEVDWEELFRGYRAAVDWPTCTFYRELAALYPQAKVILTIRDPERWYRSISDTILQTLMRPAPDNDAVLQAHLRMVRKLIIQRTFGGRPEDREHAISVYERHNEAVKRAIPPERLLVYEVAQGWEPLCRFLGVPVPEEAFPQANTTEDFRQMVAARVEQGANALR